MGDGGLVNLSVDKKSLQSAYNKHSKNLSIFDQVFRLPS